MAGLLKNSYRRWSIWSLIVSAVMLISGETLLRGHLGEIGFLFFWMACFGFTMLAMLMALLDLSSVQRRARKQQRELLEGTLEEIVHQKEKHQSGEIPE
jgi:uncharacterized membrane protein